MQRAAVALVALLAVAGAVLLEAVLGDGVTVTSIEPELLEIAGLTAEEIGEVAAAHRLTLHELTPQQASLEEAFMTLTAEDVEFKTTEQLAAGVAA